MKFFQKLFPQPTSEETQQRLMEILRFSKRDLKANQNGLMSREQHYWFVDRCLRRTLSYIAVMTFCSWLLYQSTQQFVIVFCIVPALAFGLVQGWKMLVDLVTRKVAVVSGTGKLRGGGRMPYLFEVKETEFSIPQNLHKALVSNLNYTVYYSRRAKIIVAIEVD